MFRKYAIVGIRSQILKVVSFNIKRIPIKKIKNVTVVLSILNLFYELGKIISLLPFHHSNRQNMEDTLLGKTVLKLFSYLTA